jgi:hypothetical protein
VSSAGPARAALAGLAIAAAMTGCFLRSATTRRLTGTCAGACDHYLACKRDDDPAKRVQCVRECGDIFSDEDSLMAFESLSCRDAVEYVDGAPTRVGQR